MRYFGFVLKTNSEQIKENATINLREYAYQNPVAAMNSYMYHHMKNGICYFAYREEREVTLAVFSYDERKWLLRDVYDYILEIYTFTEKYPAQTGKFYMNIVAGHIGTGVISEDPNFHDIYYDGESHYYIDGTVLDNGTIRLLS